jgi:hypothetical protein
VARHPGKPTLQRFTAELEGTQFLKREARDNATDLACVQVEEPVRVRRMLAGVVMFQARLERASLAL